MDTLLKWIGSKRNTAETIVSFFPSEFNRYFEPFFGGGAVFCELHLKASEHRHSKDFVSDALPFLMGVYRLAKENPEALKKRYTDETSPYSDDPDAEYDALRARFSKTKDPADFAVLTRLCYGGIIRFRKSDGYMSTPRGPHSPISTEAFARRVDEWGLMLSHANVGCEDFSEAMLSAKDGDVVYCDPPYPGSQSIVYGAQSFDIARLWDSVASAKARGAKVAVSVGWKRENGSKDVAPAIPDGIFARKVAVGCGKSMIERINGRGSQKIAENVDDLLLLTW